MTLQEMTGLLTPFVVALGREMDGPTFRAYHRVLEPAPAVLLEAALAKFATEGVRFVPGAPELLAKCEQARRAVLALHPYEGCADCEHSKGFIDVKRDGVWYVQPCPCKARHAEKLARLGVGAPVAQIAAEASGDSEQVYPTAEQLPAPVRQRLDAISAQKVLR